MIYFSWKKAAAAAFCHAAMLWVAPSAGAQELPPVAEIPSPKAIVTQGQKGEVEDLRARLERLEAQNKLLIDTVRQLQSSQVLPAGAQAAPAPAAPARSMQDEVKAVVSNILKERDEKKKVDEAEAKKRAEAEGSVVGANLGLTAKWNHGLNFESSDKAFKIHIGGRTQFDIATVGTNQNVQFGTGGIGAFDDATNFRRARLVVEGTFWEFYNFAAEYDFLNTFDAGAPAGVGGRRAFVENTPVPTDLWVEVTHLPWIGNLRIGNHKPWISFEHLTSSRFLNFMERSYQFDSFIENGNNGFSPGISMWDYAEDESRTWQFGVFKNTRSIMGWNIGDGEWMVNGRATFAPIHENEGRQLVHFGLGAYYGDTDDDVVRYRSRTMVRNGPAALHNIVAISQLNADNQFVFNPELVVQNGPWLLQAEYTGAYTGGVTNVARSAGVSTAAPGGRNYYAQGGYAEILYFLTGEHRHYDAKQGRFVRVIPHRNAFLTPGECGNIFSQGAWQVGARYSWLDLDDNDINGGRINSLTLGLNWFLNPNFKIQWNYEYGHRSVAGRTSSGDYNSAGVRFAYDF